MPETRNRKTILGNQQKERNQKTKLLKQKKQKQEKLFQQTKIEISRDGKKLSFEINRKRKTFILSRKLNFSTRKPEIGKTTLFAKSLFKDQKKFNFCHYFEAEVWSTLCKNLMMSPMQFTFVKIINQPLGPLRRLAVFTKTCARERLWSSSNCPKSR